MAIVGPVASIGPRSGTGSTQRRGDAEDECAEQEQDGQQGSRFSQVRACRKVKFDPFMFFCFVRGWTGEGSVTVFPRGIMCI